MITPLSSIDSLVVRCPNWVGDIVMATPVYECLRQNFPNAEITACIRPYARGILEDSPWFDHIVAFQDKKLSGMSRIRTELRQLRPQAGILLTNSTHSWLTFSLAGVKQLYGYRRGVRRHFLTDGPEPLRTGDKKIKPVPMQDYYLEICRFLELELPENPKPALYLSEQLEEKASRLLAGYGITDHDTVIGLNPGASFGSSKCWPPEYFARLAEILQAKYSCKLLLLVGPGEHDIASSIMAESQADIINTATDQVDLALLKPLVKRCDLLITNDTGPRHYAVAFDVPVIVVMGPTNPIYTASNLDKTQVIQKDLPCVPCHKKTCPLGHHNCMREILPDNVMAEVSVILGATD